MGALPVVTPMRTVDVVVDTQPRREDELLPPTTVSSHLSTRQEIPSIDMR